MMGYKVLVYENNHYGDEDERIDYGVFATADEAIAKSKWIIDDDLKWMWKPGMSAADLYQLYICWGPDPVVVPLDPKDPEVAFSAWPYAKERCREIVIDPALAKTK
jgi:hypothetical protein